MIVVVLSEACASVVSAQLVPGVAVTPIAARYVVTDVITSSIVLFTFVHVCKAYDTKLDVILANFCFAARRYIQEARFMLRQLHLCLSVDPQ